jgi:hypothetical protein
VGSGATGRVACGAPRPKAISAPPVVDGPGAGPEPASSWPVPGSPGVWVGRSSTTPSLPTGQTGRPRLELAAILVENEVKQPCVRYEP